jgi:hypothetical protein
MLTVIRCLLGHPKAHQNRDEIRNQCFYSFDLADRGTALPIQPNSLRLLGSLGVGSIYLIP